VCVLIKITDMTARSIKKENYDLNIFTSSYNLPGDNYILQFCQILRDRGYAKEGMGGPRCPLWSRPLF